MVRLKGVKKLRKTVLFKVSIPYGTIKRSLPTLHEVQ